MEYPNWLVAPSMLATRILYRKRNMSLSAKAMELAHEKGERQSRMTRNIDRIFWFHPEHCKEAYLCYRLRRLNEKKERPDGP